MDPDTVGIEWVDGDDGRVYSLSLAVVGEQAFERAAPMRKFSSYRRQRHHPGWYWSATTASLVGFESWLERDRLMLLDRDAQVTGIASQPFRLSWPEEQRRVTHVPDYFARMEDGSALVVDVRPESRIGPKDESKFQTTRRICAQMDRWEYRLLHEPEAVSMANVRWLAGYRHPRNDNREFAARLRKVFSAEQPLGEGVAAAGDPLVVLPVFFHLLWRGDLHANLDIPLDDGSLVTAVSEAS